MNGRVQKPAHIGFACHHRVHQRALRVDRQPSLADETARPVRRLPALDRCRLITRVSIRQSVADDGVGTFDAAGPCPGDVRAQGLAPATAQIARVVLGQVQDPLREAKSRQPPAPQPQVRANALTGRALAHVEPRAGREAEQPDQVRKRADPQREARGRGVAGVAQRAGAVTRLRKQRTAIAGRPPPARPAVPTGSRAACSSACASRRAPRTDSCQRKLRGSRGHPPRIDAISAQLEGRST
jgi:hypothetical protein